MARDLSDTMILPLDVVNFATELNNLITTLDTDYGDILRNHSIAFGKMFLQICQCFKLNKNSDFYTLICRAVSSFLAFTSTCSNFSFIS